MQNRGGSKIIMNFLRKKICLTGDFRDLKGYKTQFYNNYSWYRSAIAQDFNASGIGFKKEEMKFLISQLGGILTTHESADIILIGEKPDENIINYAIENSILTVDIEELGRLIASDEEELFKNSDLLKSIQEYLVMEEPRYLGRNVLDYYAVELIQKKLQDPKLNKTWLKQFIENIFINPLLKKRLISEYCAEKNKKYFEEWLKKNGDLKTFKENKLKNLRNSLVVMNDDELTPEDLIAAITKKCSMLIFAPFALRSDKKFIIELIQNAKNAYNSANILLYMDKSLKNDEDIFLETVKNLEFPSYYMKFVSAKIKSNPQLILQAMVFNIDILEFLCPNLLNDIDFVLNAIEINPDALRYVNSRFRSTKEVVLKAVSKKGKLLECVNKKFKKDRAVVLAAVKNYGDAIYLADDWFRNDEEIVTIANNNS